VVDREEERLLSIEIPLRGEKGGKRGNRNLTLREGKFSSLCVKTNVQKEGVPPVLEHAREAPRHTN